MENSAKKNVLNIVLIVMKKEFVLLVKMGIIFQEMLVINVMIIVKIIVKKENVMSVKKVIGVLYAKILVVKIVKLLHVIKKVENVNVLIIIRKNQIVKVVKKIMI